MSSVIEEDFPNLVRTGYKKTSPVDERYNCIAWAANDSKRWWQPDFGYYWPVGELGDYSVDAVVKVFKHLGYKDCKSSDFELGFEKVAIYGDGTLYTHAARQLPSGLWASKLGAGVDIEHSLLEGLISSMYGSVAYILRRPTN
jgi:hypothetical protein